MTGYVGVDPENGYRILADLKGPGYVNHIWIPWREPSDLHIYIDGELVVDMQTQDFIAGSAFPDLEMLSYQTNTPDMSNFEPGYQGAIILNVPITYNESCVIEVDSDVRSSLYYIVGYYDLEEGASVDSFTWPLSDSDYQALREANAILADDSIPYGDTKFQQSVAPGETVTVYEAASAGAIKSMTLDLNIPQVEFDDQTSLVDWQIAVYWDGSDTPAAVMPVADFSGAHYGLYDMEFDNAGYGVRDGVLYTTWYMPYNFLGQMSAQGEQQDGTPLSNIQAKAVEELRQYAKEALARSQELQADHIRLAMAWGMVDICAAADGDVPALLEAGKKEIDTVLATEYEEELEVDRIDDLFYEGAQMLDLVVSKTGDGDLVAQGLEILSMGGHMFWMSAVGDALEVKLDVPYSNTYLVELGYTMAGDFGIYDVYLDGKLLGRVDAYAGTLAAESKELSEVELTAGEHVLKFVVTGKNDSSMGSFVGIDHLILKFENSELMQHKISAAKDLREYKKESDYSPGQWRKVQETLDEYLERLNNAATLEEAKAVWKDAKAALDAIPSIVFDDALTPGDFGWSTDNDDFTIWQTTAEGDMFYVAYNGEHSKRIWNSELIKDPNDFTVKLTVRVEEWRAYIEILGVAVELNCEHGNGNQIFDRESWSWFDALDQKCDVTIARSNGGDLQIKLEGAGDPTPVTFTKAVVDESKTDLIIGLYDDPASAFFSNITATGAEGQSVEDFGWDTDGAEGEKDFSGWTAVDGSSITGTRGLMTGSGRIWKDLIADPDDFTISLDVTVNSTTSAYVKLFGNTVEIDGNGGNGSQFIAKLNGTICLVDGKDWIDAEGGKVTVQIARKDGGDLTITISGSQAVLELKAAVAENNENLELGLYRGEARYENIAVSEVDPGEDPGGDVPETSDEPLLPALLLMLLSIVAAVALRTKKKKIV